MIFNIKEKPSVKLGDFNWRKDKLKDYFLITKRNDPFLEKLYQNSINEISKIFKIDKSRIKKDLELYVWKSRKTYDILSGRKSEQWEIARGFEREMGLFILDRDSYKTESNHKYDPSKLLPLLKHEVVHSFFYFSSEGVMRPIWFAEGVSIYFSGQTEFISNFPQSFSLFIDSFSNCQNSNAVYSQSGHAVKLLVENFGKQKLLNLISSLKDVKDQKDFNKQFKEIYGKNPTYKFFNDLRIK